MSRGKRLQKMCSIFVWVHCYTTVVTTCKERVLGMRALAYCTLVGGEIIAALSSPAITRSDNSPAENVFPKSVRHIPFAMVGSFHRLEKLLWHAFRFEAQLCVLVL